MKSFCTTGLILLAGLGWATSQANAQSSDGGQPSLLPLPRVTPASSELVTASYTTSPKPAQGPKAAEPFSSSFNNRAQTQAPPEESLPSESTNSTSFDDALHAPCWDDCEGCNVGCANGSEPSAAWS